jgi:hypothetical protein
MFVTKYFLIKKVVGMNKNNFKKEALFSEIADLSNKKVRLENKLIDLYYEELNLCSDPNQFDFFPKNNQNDNDFASRFNNAQNNSSGERTIGNTIVCFPKKFKTVDLNNVDLKKIKFKKVDLLKKLNILGLQINILEHQYNSLKKKRQFMPWEE